MIQLPLIHFSGKVARHLAKELAAATEMDSGDQGEVFVVKIEVDDAEEPPVFWRTGKDEQGQLWTSVYFSH